MYRFKAKVIAGRGRGAKLGFPTANLDKLNLKIDHGIYLAEVELAGRIYQGLLHYGRQKTFSGELTCEVFIKNFNKNIYGRELAVKVGGKIREIKKFKNAEELKKQMEKDLYAWLS